MNEMLNEVIPQVLDGQKTEKWSRNTSVMLQPEKGYCLMQIRDDVKPEIALQIFGGWAKGYRDVYDAANPFDSTTVEDVGATIQREMANELGLGITNGDFLPFMDSAIYKQERTDGKNRLVFLTYAPITPAVPGKLPLREGAAKLVLPLDDDLLRETFLVQAQDREGNKIERKVGLYPNDRRMLTHYLRNRSQMDDRAIAMDFAPIPADLASKITVYQDAK